ncbi:translocon-associated protein, delta subunit precursor (TRAP-delta) domain-containing protein [Ditylenchus destructor]|nr:translocon-associated protein, delta subunit precursor (TRAP-delta) domain-containing protein [Ditylenchus destructor]
MINFCLLLVLFPALVFGSNCESPKYSSSTFSTLDGFFHYTTSHIAEFALQCANNPRDLQLYAVVDGKVHVVAASEETSKYQVSWQQEHSGSRTFDIKIYDEEKLSEYRKAEREGGDVNSVAPLFTISHYHAGVSKKSPISPEVVFLVLSAAAVYYVSVYKSQLKN